MTIYYQIQNFNEPNYLVSIDTSKSDGEYTFFYYYQGSIDQSSWVLPTANSYFNTWSNDKNDLEYLSPSSQN
jgi:hypothetical protein